jgi:hypothetical protein
MKPSTKPSGSYRPGADDPDPPQKPMSEEERKQFRERLRKLDLKSSKPQKKSA